MRTILLMLCLFSSAIARLNHRRLSDGNFNDDIKKAIELAYNSLNMDEPLGRVIRRMAFNMDMKSFELQKYQFAKKILSDNPTYLAVFGGSSVTAGHDGRYNESYPEVFGRKLKSAMEAVGINFTVHNIAQGNNNCFPSNACYETMGGFDPDFVGWEQSFNCGHNEEFFEIAARFALWSKNPGMVYYAQSGSIKSGEGCPPSKFNPPYTDERWTPKSVSQPSLKPSWDTIKELKADMIKSFQELGPAAVRFAGAAFAYQKRGAPLAISGVNFFDERKDEECKGLGVPSGKCSVAFLMASCNNLKFTSEAEAAIYGNGRGAAHHPTRAGHLHRGETVAYTILLPFLDALFEVAADLESGTADKKMLLQKYTTKYESLYTLKTMPDPRSCHSKPYFDCTSKPRCYTDYHPHYAGNMSLSELLVGTTKWSYNFRDYEHWTFPDQEHLELRPGYSASRGPSSGEIHFKIDLRNCDKAIVTVVAYHYTNFLLATDFFIELNVAESRLQNYTPDKEKWHLWEDFDPLKYLHETVAVLEKIPPGLHVMSMKSKLNEKKAVAGISHIVVSCN